MAYASSISLSKTEFKLVRKVYPSTVEVPLNYAYEFQERVKVNMPGAADSYTGFVHDITSKQTVISRLKSYKLGGIISSAEYATVRADVASTLTKS
jgi:hypothetical protein